MQDIQQNDTYEKKSFIDLPYNIVSQLLFTSMAVISSFSYNKSVIRTMQGGTRMKWIKEYKNECLIAIMMLTETMTVFFPSLFPNGFSEVILLCLLLTFILQRLHMADLALKRKYN